MGGTVDSNPKAPLLEVGVAAEKKPEATAASDKAGKDGVTGALTIEEPAGVDAAVEQDGKEDSEANTNKKEGQAETVAQDGPIKTDFTLKVSLEIKEAFSAAFEGLGRLATAAYRRGTKLGKLMTGGITAPIHVVLDLLKDKLPKESPKGAASNAAEGKVLNSGPSLSVAGNAGGTSAQLQNMAQRLDKEIAPQFTDLQKTSYDKPAAATQSAQAASMPTAFKLGKKSAGSIVAAAADSGSVSPGAAVPIKARTVKM